MKIKTIILSIFLIYVVNALSAQTIELGGNFSSSNEVFYKNAFGGNVGYVQNFKKQLLFLQFKSIINNDSYSQVANDITGWPDQDYYIIAVDSRMTINAIKLGIAQKLVNNDFYSISLGASGSLNNVKFDEDLTSIYFAEKRIGSVSNRNETESYKNRFAYGAFFDLELKQFLVPRMTLYSRVEIEDLRLVNPGSMGLGIPFEKSGYSTIGFSLGLRYTLKKE